MVSLEGRLTGAIERINVLGTLLQMKEVRLPFLAYFPHSRKVELRNSQAVLAAERRLFWLREERRKEVSLGEHTELPQTSSPEENLSFLSDVRIDPEVEALLRTIFRHLDPSDCGTVDITVLHSCLLTARSHGLLPPPVKTNEDPCVCEDTLWDRFLGSLCDLIQAKNEASPADVTITWGEVSSRSDPMTIPQLLYSCYYCLSRSHWVIQTTLPCEVVEFRMRGSGWNWYQAMTGTNSVRVTFSVYAAARNVWIANGKTQSTKKTMSYLLAPWLPHPHPNHRV